MSSEGAQATTRSPIQRTDRTIVYDGFVLDYIGREKESVFASLDGRVFEFDHEEVEIV